MKKRKQRLLTRLPTVVFIIVSILFAWEWRQQTPKQTLGKQTNPKGKLLVRCLEKAQQDYDENMGDTNSAPEPQLAKIAAETFEADKIICHDIYDQ